MTLTLRARLALTSSVVFGLLLAGFGVLSYEVLAHALDVDTTERLTQLADGLQGYLKVDHETASVVFDADDSDQVEFVHDATRYYQVYDLATGRRLAASQGIVSLRLRLTQDQIRSYGEHPRPFDTDTPYGAMRISNTVGPSVGGAGYLLQVGVPLAPVAATLDHYRDLLLWWVPLGCLAAALAAWWLSGFALRPLAEMATAARAIDVRALEVRLPVRGADDELDHVAVAFNDTLGRLERSVGEMRQFSAALAHELRTPLAGLRGSVELDLRAPGTTDAKQRSLASQIETIDHLTRLIRDTLTMARAESGQIPLAAAPVHLGRLATSIVSQLEPVAEARAVELLCDRADDAVVDGDEGWLGRLMLNLIDNSLKYTPAEGRIAVRVSRDATTARIEVHDSGVGLSEADASQVFDRFFRGAASCTSGVDGAGLGLSLVQWIADQHGGGVSVTSELGHGSVFVATLPLRAPALDMKKS